MYNEVKCISITCDNCGADFIDDHTGFSIFVDEISANDNVDNTEWCCEDGKHYCPECHTINDNDELVIDTTRTIIPEKSIYASLDGCPFNYCCNTPKCEGKCSYA